MRSKFAYSERRRQSAWQPLIHIKSFYNKLGSLPRKIVLPQFGQRLFTVPPEADTAAASAFNPESNWEFHVNLSENMHWQQLASFAAYRIVVG